MKSIAKQKGSGLKVKDPKGEVNWDITWQGPDWNGFMTAVENSAMTDKRAVLNVIKSADQSKREEEIRNMILIYPEIEKDMLPPLRRAEIKVNCYEPKRTDEQIMAYGLEYPDSLKVNELLYAATFYEDPVDQLAIYLNTIEYFPTCYRAYNNAGMVLTELGDYEDALLMLAEARALKPDDGAISNNLGVLACKVGDYEDAEAYFLEAQEQGENVNYNLGTLAILAGEYAEAQRLMAGNDCDHNVGLVQLLKKDYTAAERTLKCAPADGLTYYLLAITAARQDNTQALFENLMLAVEMDPELIYEARNDREFLKYNMLPEFQAIVQ
jgi:tetratricopeptide (TPR) repeat protein